MSNASESDRPPEELLDAIERRARQRAGDRDETHAGTPDVDLVQAFRSASPDASADDDGDRNERDEDDGHADAAAETRDAADGDAAGDAAADAAEPPDRTLIGYVERHDRPPAFTGIDEQPYTVDVDVEPTGDAEEGFAAFLVFIRWAATGAGIMGHVESGDVAYGRTADAARAAALQMSLYDVKAELDEAIRRRRREMED